MWVSMLRSACTMIMRRLRWSLTLAEACSDRPVEPDWFRISASTSPPLKPRMARRRWRMLAVRVASTGEGPA